MGRTERDPLGEHDVPTGAYYGIQTQRAAENFPISGLRAPDELVTATILIKKAAAAANMSAGMLPPEIGRAIVAAADEVLGGKLRDQFIVDVYQAGAGTSHNMNANEVLANRAAEILGGAKGSYDKVHPERSREHVAVDQRRVPDRHPARAAARRISRSSESARRAARLARGEGARVRRRPEGGPDASSGCRADHAWARSSAATLRASRSAADDLETTSRAADGVEPRRHGRWHGPQHAAPGYAAAVVATLCVRTQDCRSTAGERICFA